MNTKAPMHAAPLTLAEDLRLRADWVECDYPDSARLMRLAAERLELHEDETLYKDDKYADVHAWEVGEDGRLDDEVVDQQTGFSHD